VESRSDVFGTEYMPCPTIAPKHTGKVPTECLDFDPSNPRLVEDGIKNPTDSQIILALADTADLSEVVESIAANGYIDIEPVIAQRVKDRWRVLEGNRRLAAIRLLKNPSLSKGTGISVPEISPENLKTLNGVTVFRSAHQQGFVVVAKKHYVIAVSDAPVETARCALLVETQSARHLGIDRAVVFRGIPAEDAVSSRGR